MNIIAAALGMLFIPFYCFTSFSCIYIVMLVYQNGRTYTWCFMKCACVCMCACVCNHACVHLCTCALCICTCMHAWVHVYSSVWMQAQLCVCVCALQQDSNALYTGYTPSGLSLWLRYINNSPSWSFSFLFHLKKIYRTFEVLQHTITMIEVVGCEQWIITFLSVWGITCGHGNMLV